MTLDDRIHSALADSAEAHGIPPSELESVIVRGRRRRMATRLLTVFGSGTALVVTLVVTVSFRQAASEPEVVIGDQTESAILDTTGTAKEISILGHIAEDEAGYTLVSGDDGDTMRFLEAHTSQVEGDARFGPAISDGAGGFIYTVSDVVEGSETRQGWVLWVPAGAAEPIVIADEPDAGVDQVIGVIRDGAPFAVYTTVAGRTVQLRRAQLTAAPPAPTTLVDDFATGDAAAERIIVLGTEDGCSTFRVLDARGNDLPIAGILTGACRSVDQATLSPDGRRVAYLDRTDESNLVVVVDLATSAIERSVSLDSRNRIVGFDGTEVLLTGGTAIDVATGAIRRGAARTDGFEVKLNSLLVLQIPGVGESLSFDEAQAAFSNARPPDSDLDEDIDLLVDYLANGWSVELRPDPDAAATPVDLDAFGVTLRGLGPYVLGTPIQRNADESGHDLLSNESTSRCRTMRISPLGGVSGEDVTVVADGDRLVGLEFASSRFSFDGVTVGTSLAEAMTQIADAEIATRGNATVLVLDIDGESQAQFWASGDTITGFSVSEPEACVP